MDVRLHERGDGRSTAKNNAGRICNHDGPVFLLAPDTVRHPQRAVNGGNERLNSAALMAVDIADNLRHGPALKIQARIKGREKTYIFIFPPAEQKAYEAFVGEVRCRASWGS